MQKNCVFSHVTIFGSVLVAESCKATAP